MKESLVTVASGAVTLFAVATHDATGIVIGCVAVFFGLVAVSTRIIRSRRRRS